MRRLVAASALILLTAAIANAQPPLPYAPVPPPRAETVPPPPGSRYIWEPGHWRWTGREYVWVQGRYVQRRPHYHEWVPGHWQWSRRFGRWEWINGHWR